MLRNLVVHDVGGEAKSKVSGLVVVTASSDARVSDVLIDGVTAYHTNQWAGIIVNGASRERRVRNVNIRNSIVHDVYGDGIILFSVEDGLIERSAAWLTGLFPDDRVGISQRRSVRHMDGPGTLRGCRNGENHCAAAAA